MQRIGFIGVGMMGHGMAENLLRKGYAVTALAHRNRKRVENLVLQGAIEAPTAKAVAEQSDIVIICVTGSPEVEAVVYGAEGVLEGCHPGLIVIDCTTSEPALTERLARDLDTRGVTIVDAPLARTPKEAAEGRLNTMVGAADDVFAKVRPILEAFCENVVHMGPVGSGHKTKLIYNFLTMGYSALIAEALSACAATDVNADKFYDVVSAGGANSGIFQLIVPAALKGDYTGLLFSLRNAEKDVRYYTRMTEAVPLTGSMGNAVHHALIQGLNLGFADGLIGSLIEAQAKLNGIVLDVDQQQAAE